jgi:hypothetical protein
MPYTFALKFWPKMDALAMKKGDQFEPINAA